MRTCFLLAFAFLTLALCKDALGGEPTSSKVVASPRLFIHGGGGLERECERKLLELAGGEMARLVVIPTATGDATLPTLEKLRQVWGERGFKDVSMLHTREQSEANEEGFVNKLNDATAIWISGGSQSRLSSAYVGTRVEQKLYELRDRGVLIGGSSAGAAIQSQVMIALGREAPMIGTGFNLLPNAIIDQHFLRRARINRLLKAVQLNPDRTGVGIDESTSLIVDGDHAHVSGRSYVVVVREIQGEVDIRSYKPGSGLSLDHLGVQPARSSSKKPTSRE